jgi:hypothetical protein
MTSSKRSKGLPKKGKPTNVRWTTTPSGKKRKD